MSDKSSSKSNYDRWKAGTKLACMMALKRVASNEEYYDIENHKFASTSWHIVAESLNKEYPGYAKRFTNVNVKDRYDRVMKHHKVFKRMANRMSGFAWNPKMFGFDNGEDDVMSQYEQGLRTDPIIKKETNVVKFLCKPGHIDLEYFHRYISHITEEEAEGDMVLNSPSYIEDAISKGVLTSNTVRPTFPKDKNSSTTTATTASTSNTSLDTRGSVSNSGTEVPQIDTQQQQPQTALQHTSSTSSLQAHPALSQPHVITQGTLSMPSAQNHLQSTVMSPSSGLQHLPVNHYQQGPMIGLPPMMQNGIPSMGGLPIPATNPYTTHMHSTSVPPTMSSMQQQQQSQQGQDQDQNQSSPQQHQQLPHPLSQLTQQHQNSHPHSQQQHHQQGLPHQNGFAAPPPPSSSQQQQSQQQQQQQQQELDFGTGLMDQGGMISQMGPMSSMSMGNTSVDSERSRKRMRTSTPSHLIQTGMMFDTFDMQQQQQQQQQQQDGSVNSRTSGDALMFIHKEFEMMKNEVSEKILQLRVNKIIDHNDFVAIQDVIENVVPFLRSAYKRLRDDAKLVEIINIYLNKDS